MPRRRKSPLPRDVGRGKPKIPVAAPAVADPDSVVGPEEPNDGVPRDRLGRERATETTEAADANEMDRRIGIIRKALIQGFPTSDIYRYVDSETDWGISHRQVDRYIAEALATIREAAKVDRELEVGKAIGRNELIFRQAIAPTKVDGKSQPPDLRVAARTNALNAHLMGLVAPQRIRHGADPDSPPLPAGGDFILLVQEVAE